MGFKVLNFVERSLLLIIFQIPFVIPVNIHANHDSQPATKEFTSSKPSYLDDDPNLFLNEFSINKENSDIIIRHLRQVKLNNEINRDIDKLNIQITNLTETVKNQSSKNETNSNLTFSRPNSSGTYTKLEKEIKKIKEDIEKMKRAPNVADSSKLRFSALEKSVETLQKLFDNNNRELVVQMENLESFVDGLTNTVIGVRRELDQINLHLLPAEIIDDIKGRDFSNAVGKILKLNNLERQVNLIVHEVYDNNERNLDLILKFANSSTSVRLSVLIYSALFYEIESNKHIGQKELLEKVFLNLASDKSLHVLMSDKLLGVEPKEQENLQRKILYYLENIVFSKPIKVTYTGDSQDHIENTKVIVNSVVNALTFGIFNN